MDPDQVCLTKFDVLSEVDFFNEFLYKLDGSLGLPDPSKNWASKY